MGTALQNGDILSARVWCTLAEQAAVNTYNFSVFSVIGGAVTDQDLANALDVLTAPFYKGLQTTQSTYDGVQVYFIKRSGSLPAPVSTIVSAGPGGSAAHPLPPNTAGIFSYNTFMRGPGGRGRLYLPFMGVDQVAADGRMTVGVETLINSFASVLLLPLTLTSGGSSATCSWSLLTRHPKPAPPTTAQIMEAKASGKFGQMHKRGQYGKANASPI